MATAQINFIRIDHNIFMGLEKGMVVHVGFDVQNLAAQTGNVVAYFNYWQGAPLRDFDKQYTTDDGHVATGIDFVPNFDAANFPDMQLFIPYSQLHMAPGTAYLMCHIIIWDKSRIVPEELAKSAWIQFYVQA
jgi:hypothetical protein